ncbi:MAG: ferritin-like domain-containing protein [Candidatus Binatia bacterium]
MKDDTLNTRTTINPAFNAVARDDFSAMIESQRYLSRSQEFETIIARTNEHFWDPQDADYIDYQCAAPCEQPLIPFEQIPERHSAIWDKLDEAGRLRFTNESLRMRISGVLHGEQGALSLSTGLADMFVDPGAQEYACNQAREEARHVHAFTLYLEARFDGNVMNPSPTLGRVLRGLVASEVIYEKVIGMQMLIEGLAMGIFTSMYQGANDPLLRRLSQLVMTDEAFHHKFGQIWARENVVGIDEELRNLLEDYCHTMFDDLLMNLVSPEQKVELYRSCGIDPGFAIAAMKEAISDDARRDWMRSGSNIFRTLIKTLWSAGLISERTRSHYDVWVDMDEIAGEGDWTVGADIAESGIADLAEINAGKRRIIKPLTV